MSLAPTLVLDMAELGITVVLGELYEGVDVSGVVQDRAGVGASQQRKQ